MGKVFTRGPNRYEFFDWHEAPADGDFLRFTGLNTAIDFLRSFVHDLGDLGELRSVRLSRELSSQFQRQGTQDVLEGLAQELVAGRLKVLHEVEELHQGRLGTREPPGEPQQPVTTGPRIAQRRESTEFIEIQVLDANDKPVQDVLYEITWPDGETKTKGKTNYNGMARIEPIDPGLCEIRFPKLHSVDWEKI